MDRIINEITLDFTQNISLASVNIKQGDDGGRLIRVYLKNNGLSVPVSTANGDTATLYASVNGMITADGTAAIINDTTNTVDILITSTLSAAAGREYCEIRITSGTGKIHTARFTILVGAASASADMPEVVKTADILDLLDEAESEISLLTGRVSYLEYRGIGVVRAYELMRLLRGTMPDCHTATITINVSELEEDAQYGYKYVLPRPIGACDFDPTVDLFQFWITFESDEWGLAIPGETERERRTIDGNMVSFGNWLMFAVSDDSITLYLQTVTNTHKSYTLFVTHRG